MAISANCLQPDGQNDNDWDQGLLFLNPSHVWLQPPGYVTQMVSGNYQPCLVATEVKNSALDVSGTCSEDKKTLVLNVVNLSPQPVSASVNLPGFLPSRPTAGVQTLAGSLDARNTADNPSVITPVLTEWQHGIKEGATSYVFPANSFTVIRFN